MVKSQICQYKVSPSTKTYTQTGIKTLEPLVEEEHGNTLALNPIVFNPSDIVGDPYAIGVSRGPRGAAERL